MSRRAQVIGPEQEGQRLDQVVVALGASSKRKAQEAVRRGKVDVDGRPCTEPGARVAAGSTVSVHWSRPGTSRVAHKGRQGLDEAGLVVLYEDEHLLAVDKPPGLLTDAASHKQARERDTVRKRLRPLLKPRGQRPWIVHRIDRDTSGVVLVAREESVSVGLRDAFARHEPERTYLALVHGHLRPDEGEWADLMAWDGKQRIQRQVQSTHSKAVLAQARYRVVERLRGATLVEVSLVTGRRNQIRLHAMLRGHPLVGERLYLPEGFAPPRGQAPRQALHAVRLALAHPVTGEPLELRSPLPEDFQRMLAVRR